MPPPRRQRNRLRFGATLIELLVAVAITTLILSTLFSVYFTLSSASNRMGARQQRQPAGEALGIVRRDLACALVLPGGDRRPFQVDVGADGSNTYIECYSASVPADADLEQFAIQRVRYELVHDAAGERGLIRESVWLSGPENGRAPVRQNLLRDATGFQVQVLGRGSWTNRWSSALEIPLPRAAHVTMTWESDGRTESMETWTPVFAGNQPKAEK